jgi:signal peptidase I
MGVRLRAWGLGAAVLASLLVAGCNRDYNSGDRVLVAKFMSDLHLADLKPLDVVVFKFPEETTDAEHAPKNYIKRLIGMPTQTIGIYYGDIYVAAQADLEKKGISFEPTEDERSLPLRRRMYRDRAKELLEAGDPVFKILRKPPDKILAVERRVFDNEFPPEDLDKYKYARRWAPEADPEAGAESGAGETSYKDKRDLAEKSPHSWKANDPHGFAVESGAEGPTSWLRYRHVLRRTIEKYLFEHEDEADPVPVGEPELITDFLSYNSFNVPTEHVGVINRDTGKKGWIIPGTTPGYTVQKNVYDGRWVGDLILECEVKVEKAEGELILELSKGAERYQARWDLSTGECALARGTKKELASKQRTVLATRETKVKRPGTYHLRLANVDERLTVWVDGKLPFGDGVAYDPPKDKRGAILRGPTAENDLEPVSIGARGGAALAVHKLKLWRDLYYTLQGGSESDKIIDHSLMFDPKRWKDEYSLSGMTLYVQPGHYLCLGDNSPASADSRSWSKENTQDGIGGLVPENMMLGRALLVYWPLSRVGRIK